MLRRHTEGVVIDSFYEVYIVGYKYSSDLRKIFATTGYVLLF